MGFFSASKDRIVEQVAQAMLNRSVLQAYGRMRTLTLNSEQKRIEATLELKGEPNPVQIQLQDYELIEENGRLFLRVGRVSTSREWLTALANDWAAGRRFALPPEAASVIARCL